MPTHERPDENISSKQNYEHLGYQLWGCLNTQRTCKERTSEESSTGEMGLLGA